MRPILLLLAGIALAALPFIRRKPARAAPAVAAVDPATMPAPVSTTFPKLPKLLLLNLEVTATPESVETAPPLGSRREVIQILSGVIQDLVASPTAHVFTRGDGSLTLDLGRHDPVATVVVDARGEAGVALVKEVLLMTGWRAFAPKTGLFVTVNDLDAIGALASR